MAVASAHDVAAELRKRLPGLPTKKLHKLLYYCQGHHLATFGSPLFSETISAYDMGPLVGQLWHREKNGEAPPPPGDLHEAELNTIGYVVSRYGALTGGDLERLTHSEVPWLDADRRRHPGGRVRIELRAIEAYFRREGAPDTSDDDADLALDVDAVNEWLKDAEARRREARRPDDLTALRARLARRA